MKCQVYGYKTSVLAITPGVMVFKLQSGFAIEFYWLRYGIEFRFFRK